MPADSPRPAAPPRFALEDRVVLTVGGVPVEGTVTAVRSPVGAPVRYVVEIAASGSPDGVREVSADESQLSPAPAPARFAQGDAVLVAPNDQPATVSVVYPPGLLGERRYGLVSWSRSAGAFVGIGVVDEADLAPAVVS